MGFRKKSRTAPSGPRLCFEWRTLGADSGIVPENALHKNASLVLEA